MCAVKPYSLQKIEEYENNMKELREAQEKEYLKRVELNDEYARKKVAELGIEYKKILLEEQENKRIAESSGSIYVPAEPQFFAVILIRSKVKMPPKLKTICNLLRLEKINTCVLVKNNKSMRIMLQKLRNYIAYGFLDIQTLRSLVYKRGLAKVNREIVNITNEVIEDYFNGEIRCLEEIIYHLYTGSNLFKKINSFLAPFTLSCPKGGFKGKKSKDIVEGGSIGNHYDQLHLLIRRMI